jgi:hypothetical protein
VLALLAAAVGCGPTWKQAPHDRLFQREVPRLLHFAPPDRSPSDWWDYALQTSVRPLGRALSPARYLAAAKGGRDAHDVNAFGQVPDSGWFTNRIGRRDYTGAEIQRGAAVSGEPAIGPLRVIDGKVEGASPGFIVRDSADDVWYVKLDPPAFPDLSTSAEVISSRLLWLAGYHVPEMLALDIEVDRFELSPRAKKRDDYNRRVPLLQGDLDALFTGLNPDSRGRIRALFSRRLDGQILGPFSFRGRRTGDPNDRIEHQHRRSLRGLWLFFAWLNNTDARQQNTLDVHQRVTGDGRGFIRHYLIDFGDAFGAAGTREKVASEGHLYLVDWIDLAANLITAGLRYPRWLAVRRSRYRSVGLFESRVFEPGGWKPQLPNPAFSEATRSDIFWAASILARIGERHISAAVAAGRYREPGAADYVIRTLMARRAKILRWALLDQLAVDRPRVEGGELAVDDLWKLAGRDAGALRWEARWNRSGRGDAALATGITRTGRIELAPIRAAARGHRGFPGDPFVTVRLSRLRGGPSIDVHLHIAGDRVVVAGLDR